MTTKTTTSLPPPGQVVISNPDIELPLPDLKYGYRDEPLTWSELIEIIHHKDLARLTRSSQDQRTYQIFNYHLKQQYVSSTDYLLISKFGFDAVPVVVPGEVSGGDSGDGQENQVGGDSTADRCRRRWRAQPSLAETTETQSILIENDFPYHFDDDIKHYILWKLKGGGISEREIQESKQQLQTRFNTMSTLHWTNPPSLQSIPDLDHVHVLCRLPKKLS